MAVDLIQKEKYVLELLLRTPCLKKGYCDLPESPVLIIKDPHDKKKCMVRFRSEA